MIWFTSDTHYGHWAMIHGFKKQDRAYPVLGPRLTYWNSVEEMDQAMLDACNTVVQRTDTLYHLGDFGAHPEKYRMKIRCRDIRFIWGNHDKRSHTVPFRFTWDVHMIKIGKTPCWLSHYPHAIWPSSHHGAFHLYGHCHSQREDTLDRVFPNRRSMDVGIDNIIRLYGAPRPVSETEILDRLGPRPGHDSVEFYRELRGEP